MAAESAGAGNGRVEDARLLTGRARFVDDRALDRMAHAVFVRSPVAHAEIAGIETGEARAAGALLVLTANDLPFIEQTLVTRYGHPDLRPAMMPFLARGRVRFAGEPVALVVAGSRYEAEDLAALVAVDYRPLPVIASVSAALAEGAPALHAAWPGNIAATFMHETGDAGAALGRCAGRIARRFAFARQAPVPLETRGCVADFDPGRAALTLHISTQTHYAVRENLAAILDLPEDGVRVIAEDVGGGFGSKSRPYVEEVVVSHASRVLGRPVKWIEDRLEHFQATTHSRATETDLEIGYDRDGRILAMKGRLTVDIGAYAFTSGIITAMVASGHCAGPYKIPNVSLEVVCVGTNKTPLATYRGAGQPEATFPIEALLDMAARDLGLSAVEIRARNLVTPADMPYAPHIPYGGARCRFESGDFPALLHRAAEGSGYGETVEAAGPHERAAWGLACGIESTGFVGFESAEVRIDGAGNITVLSGMSSQGQGQATAYAGVCAEILGIDADRVTVRMGDTGLLPFGRGAFASRGAVVGANAVAGAAQRLREKVLGHAGVLLQENPGSLSLNAGEIVRADGERTGLHLGDIARAAAPGGPLYDGDPALSSHFVFDTEGTLTFALAVHATKVAVDMQTGRCRILDYFIVHDAGRLLDRAIVDGQIVGGAVDGIGGAMLSELVYDGDGQLLSGTLADYAVIAAPDAPPVRLEHLHTVPTTNPLGVRGVGEGGVIPVAPAIMNAVSRAIDPAGKSHAAPLCRIPLRPEAVLRAISRVRSSRSAPRGQ
ncbi:MAG: xanthine dehydrogenase family protein molybdopterin-binding subunit [Rhodospirillaceae bacterium]|nr:xanthine dehydrogenase family protein molybdopterin-binding subunit [Rhodospirillaceae bacterium]MYH36528.1 xanthine dehydrogenase family protein molybdopterin-binding subunit [Rhodospirillaceae bacterium]MYK14678.1 xanthine dehydrogenase family protein molybdopterin-binding subunit [Rhodospirillaceae bacterium]